VNGSVVGGSGTDAGAISANGTLKSLTIAGSLTGGTAAEAGGALAGVIGSIVVGGDVDGGFLVSGSTIASVTINGSVSSLAAASSSAFIAANTIFNSLTIKGSVTGLENGTASTPVVLSAGGNGGVGKADLALRSISIGGNVSFANILAGYDVNSAAFDRHAQIGTIAVKGNWATSNIIAGATNTAAGAGNFGDANDASIPAAGTADTSTTLSSIASIKIGGTLAGTPDGINAVDHFGFVAEQITTLSVNGVKITLTTGHSNDDVPLGPTGDFNLHEVT
jgi:hypothetical protein